MDDVIYFDEPMFSDGLLAQTVDRSCPRAPRISRPPATTASRRTRRTTIAVSMARARQLVAAGKENIDLDALAAHGLPAKSFHNFRNRDGSTSFTQRFTSYFGDVVDFQWDEPFDLGKVKTDYNIYVFDAAGHFIDPNDPTSDAFFTSDNNIATDQALELMAVNPGTYQIVIAKVNDGPARRHQVRHRQRHGRERDPERAFDRGATPPRATGQSVGAMYYGITNFPEDFSSPGPVTI